MHKDFKDTNLIFKPFLVDEKLIYMNGDMTDVNGCAVPNRKPKKDCIEIKRACLWMDLQSSPFVNFHLELFPRRLSTISTNRMDGTKLYSPRLLRSGCG